MRSVKRVVEEVEIWTEQNEDVKRENSLYTAVSGGYNFKINKMSDSLSWTLVVRDLVYKEG